MHLFWYLLVSVPTTRTVLSLIDLHREANLSPDFFPPHFFEWLTRLCVIDAACPGVYKYIQYPSSHPVLLVLRARFSFQNQCISMFPSDGFKPRFYIVMLKGSEINNSSCAVPLLL